MSIVVHPDKFDTKILEDFADDVICASLLSASRAGDFDNMWFQTFVLGSEPVLLPMAQAEYKKLKGVEWKPSLKLRVKPIVDKSGSTTPSSSAAKGKSKQSQPEASIGKEGSKVNQTDVRGEQAGTAVLNSNTASTAVAQESKIPPGQTRNPMIGRLFL